MNGNFFGGALKGALAVDQQLNEAEELELRRKQSAIEREKADRELYTFDKQKEFDASMAGIDADEQAANANAEFVQGGDATDALVTQATAEIEKNTGAAVTPEHREQLEAAYSPERNVANLPGLAKEGALATARNNLTAQGATAAPGTDMLSAEQRDIIGNAYGVKPDGVTKLDMSMRRARAYQKAGDWKTADEIKKNAEADAAGEFVNAVLSRDANTMFGLYQNYPGGRSIRHIGFDGDNVMITGANGEPRAVPQYDVIASALARMDPEKAAAMITAKMREDGAGERLMATLEQRDRAAWNAISAKLVDLDAKMDAGYYNRSGKGGGSSRSGSGKADAGDYKDTLEMFGKMFPAEAGSGYSTQAPVATSAYFNLLENQPAYAQSDSGKAEMVNIAARYARGELQMTPELNTDGSWKYSIGSSNGRQYTFQNGIDPTSPAQGGKPMMTPDKVLGTLKQTFGPQYDGAAKLASSPDGIKKLQAYLRDPSKSPEDRAQAQLNLNLATQIARYQPAAQAAAESAPGAAGAQQEFTPAEQKRMQQLGIKPETTLWERATGAVTDAMESVAGSNAVASKQNFDHRMQLLRSNQLGSVAAGALLKDIERYKFNVSSDDMLRLRAIAR